MLKNGFFGDTLMLNNVIMKNIKSLQPNNEPFSVLTHFIGFIASILALIFMIKYAKDFGEIKHIIGYSIFGASMILLYAASSLYHYFPRKSKIKAIFRRIDCSMVFILIAGSYTPICLLMENRVCGKSLLILIWTICIFGIILKVANIKMKDWVSVLIYVLCGALMLTAYKPISNWLVDNNALGLLFGGSTLYLVGLIFYGLESFVPRKLFGMHEIWHLFVLCANFCHVGLMINYVLYA